MSGPQARRHSFMPRFASNTASGLPPPYDPSGGRRSSRRRHSQQPLPLYSQATALDRPRQVDASNESDHSASNLKHDFHLHSKGEASGRPWATLQLRARQPEGSQRYPKYYGGDSIRGEVKLDLTRSQTINSVQLSLRGRFITSALAEGNFSFLNQTFTIWDRGMGDPRLSPQSPSASPFNRATRFDSKLKGQYTLPFSFPFPTEICLPRKSGGLQKVVQTPQSFLERGIGASIQYELVLVLTHGLFRSNSTLSTMITYVPSTAPPSASFLRQQAYNHGGRLLPPMDDPQGWKTFPTQTVSVSRGSHKFSLHCSISLAAPLSYTRGTVLPVFLSIACPEAYPEDLALTVMAPSQALLSLFLFRRITYGPTSSKMSAWSPGRSAPSTSVNEVGTAVWWKTDRVTRRHGTESSSCDIEGEIHLSNKLEPSCNVGFLGIEYFVALVPKDKTGYDASAGQDILPDTTCPVQIATFHEEGPLPTPFTPSSISSHSRSGSSGVESLSSLKMTASQVHPLEVLHQFMV